MVEQIDQFTWRSTLLPWSSFDSLQAAEHYDSLQAQRNMAAEDRGRELLNNFRAEEVQDLELTFRKNTDLASEPVRNFAYGELQRFALKHPRFVVSEVNCSRLAAFLLGKGLRYPFNAQQLSEAYDVLVAANGLDLNEA